jgi:hypothetical protein
MKAQKTELEKGFDLVFFVASAARPSNARWVSTGEEAPRDQPLFL